MSNTTWKGCGIRAFSVAAPILRNALPDRLRDHSKFNINIIIIIYSYIYNNNNNNNNNYYYYYYYVLLLVCLGTCLSEKFQQIDNNFPWSVLLPTIEMTSTCSKLEWNHKPQTSGFTAKHSSPPISAREIAQLLYQHFNKRLHSLLFF